MLRLRVCAVEKRQIQQRKSGTDSQEMSAAMSAWWIIYFIEQMIRNFSLKSAISEKEITLFGLLKVLFPDKHSGELPGSYTDFGMYHEEMGVADICPYLLLLFFNALANQRLGPT